MLQPSQDEIARKRAERTARRERPPAAPPRPPVYPRTWVPVGGAPGRRVRIVSWNMLAQGLVRRNLFPGSDCLRAHDRIPGIAAELRAHDWDIGCFQEVDCVKDHARALGAAGYDYTYNKGFEAKQHGLMIAWRARNVHDGPRQCFCSPLCTRVAYLDDLRLNERTTGISRITRNVALFAALPFNGAAGGGVVVATTHLFWKPRYAYERARQVAVLVHELEHFRASSPEWASWPAVVAGDFNDQPPSPTYTLVSGAGAAHADVLDRELADSRVIDASVDAAAGIAPGTTTEDGDPDRILDPHRRADPGALYTTRELIDACAPGLQSAYGSAYSRVDGENLYFRDRNGAPELYDEATQPPSADARVTQSCEPKWTLYSSLFRLTLDYIFAAQCRGAYPAVTALLALHPEHVLAAGGIPRKTICASDHVLIGAEYAFT